MAPDIRIAEQFLITRSPLMTEGEAHPTLKAALTALREGENGGSRYLMRVVEIAEALPVEGHGAGVQMIHRHDPLQALNAVATVLSLMPFSAFIEQMRKDYEHTGVTPTPAEIRDAWCEMLADALETLIADVLDRDA